MERRRITLPSVARGAAGLRLVRYTAAAPTSAIEPGAAASTRASGTETFEIAEIITMWKRFADSLRCPLSGAPLELVVFQGHLVDLDEQDVLQAERLGIESGSHLRYQVQEGLLLSPSLAVAYPIAHGLPILLPYETSLHQHFASTFSHEMAKFRPKYRFPSAAPFPGETAILKSFNTQWRDYQYDGVVWDISYETNERRLLSEVGSVPSNSRAFLEVGCGVGVTTLQAQRCFGVEAVGIDLSLGALKAQQRFWRNPLLHFVQASALQLPFAPESFDIVYSRGVLHHASSPRHAFLCVSRFCRPCGRAYVWVYGTGSIDANSFRRVVHALEWCLRPILSRAPEMFATVVLAPLTVGYLLYNRLRFRGNPDVQRYDFRRALHAARDRFTPQYVHRTSSEEVIRWFREAGYQDIQLVDWRDIPGVDADDYRRNVGVRGIRSAQSTETASGHMLAS